VADGREAVTELDPRALEAAARALSELHIEASLEKGSGWRVAAHRGARAAVTAYLAEAGDGRLSELERENAALREALKPFIRAVQMAEAKTYNRGDDPAPDSYMAAPSLGITLGDLRRAAALAGSGEK